MHHLNYYGTFIKLSINLCVARFSTLAFFKNVGEHMSILGATNTPRFELLVHILWVSKLECTALFTLFVEVYMIHISLNSNLVRHLCWYIWSA